MKYFRIFIIILLILGGKSVFVLAQETETVVPKTEKKIEVLIDARLTKILLNEEHRNGVDWEAIVSNYQHLDLSQFQNKKKDSSGDIKLSIGTVTNEDYVVLLEALEVVGQVRDLANPKITAAINREAKIVWDTHMPGNGFEMQMGIAPSLQDDGLLTINLDPRLRWITKNWDIPGSREETIYSSTAGMAVRLKNDETIVIGGLTQEKEVKQMSKFPLLGDLPLVGFAFRRHNKLIEKMEYIIFLTPRIMAEESGL